MVLRRLVDAIETETEKVGKIDSAIVYGDYTITGVLPAMSGEQVLITPPENKIWQIRLCHIYIIPPPGAVSGSHDINLRVGTMYFLWGKSSFNGDIHYFCGRWESADLSKKPVDEASQLNILKAIPMDEDNLLYLWYGNATDANQTTIRLMDFYFKEVEVV